MYSGNTRSCLCLLSYPAKHCKIKNNVNRRFCLLFQSSFLRISYADLPHRGKIHEAPFSIYRVGRSDDILFLALYDSDDWDVLKVLSERTLQNMTKLTWERKRVKSAFLVEINNFSNFLGFFCLVLYMVTHYIQLLESKYLFSEESTSIWKGYLCTWRSLILEHRLVISEMEV